MEKIGFGQWWERVITRQTQVKIFVKHQKNCLVKMYVLFLDCSNILFFVH